MGNIDLSALSKELNPDDEAERQKVADLAQRTGAPELVPAKRQEKMVQVNICNVPQSVKKAIERAALESDMPIRSFILTALQAYGVPIADEVLLDKRRSG